MNVGGQRLLEVLLPFPFEKYSSGTAGSDSSSLQLLRSLHAVVQGGCTILHSASGAQGSLFTRSATLAICGLLDDSHSDRCEVTRGFDVRFPDDE